MNNMYYERFFTVHGNHSYFVYKVRVYKKNNGLTLSEAIEKAVIDCIKEDKLKEFLSEHGNEVVNMLYTEFNLEDYTEVIKEEAREEERNKLAFALLDVLDFKTISEKTGLSIKEIQKLQQKK